MSKKLTFSIKPLDVNLIKFILEKIATDEWNLRMASFEVSFEPLFFNLCDANMPRAKLKQFDTLASGKESYNTGRSLRVVSSRCCWLMRRYIIGDRVLICC